MLNLFYYAFWLDKIESFAYERACDELFNYRLH